MNSNAIALITPLSPNIETEESQTIHHISTVVTKPTLVGKPTQVENSTPVGKAEAQNCARRVTEQDSSVAFEARALEGLERGYTRVPNCLLMNLVNGEFTRNEIKVALIIARFTISFRREFAPLSKKVLERQSGLRGAAVLEAISGLVSKGVVQKQKGDQYRPNMLGLVLPADWECTSSTEKPQQAPIKAKVDSGVITQVENPTPALVGNITPGEARKTTHGEVANPTPFKDIKIYKNKISLTELPDPIQKYLSEIKPTKKRESESKAFENLKSDYAVSDIADCLNLLASRGVKAKRGAFQPCHSPMAYLAKAMNEVLGEVQQTQQAQSLSQKQASRVVDERAAHSERRAKDALEFCAMESAFHAALPSPEQQQAKIEELCQAMPFLLSSDVRRIYAINTWWSIQEDKNLNPTTNN